MSAPTWRKSTHSGTEQNACVEVADLVDGIGLRDSKNPDAGHLTLTPAAFRSLLKQARES